MPSMEQTNYIQLISNILSVITIFICFILKVPQIMKILRLKTTQGINLLGLLMELTR